MFAYNIGKNIIEILIKFNNLVVCTIVKCLNTSLYLFKRSKEEYKMEIYFHIGRKLKELREKLGYKQLEVADKINMTRSSVANIEQGRQKIQIDVLYELAYLYDVDPKDLLPDLSMITKYQEVDDKVKIQNDKTKMLNLINKLREGEGK